MTFLLLAITCALYGGSFALLAVGRQKTALLVAVVGLAVAITNAAIQYW